MTISKSIDKSIDPKNEVDQNSKSTLPDWKNEMDDVRASIANVAYKSKDPSGRLTPQELKNLFLTGKLSANQLIRELKLYNNITADFVLRDGKKDLSQVVNYNNASKGVASESAQTKSQEDLDKSRPKDLRSARKEADQEDDPQRKREAEKHEKKVVEQKRQDNIIETDIFTKVQYGQKNSHLWREIKREEDLKELENNIEEEQELDESHVKAKLKARMKAKIKSSEKLALKKKKEVSGPKKASR